MRRPVGIFVVKALILAGLPLATFLGVPGGLSVAGAATGTEMLSVTATGGEPLGNSRARGITPDARFVVFQSNSTDLVSGGTSGNQLFIRDRQPGATSLVSRDSSETQADQNATNIFAAVSDDGRYVAFDSIATNLASGDSNGTSDVFVHDRDTGATERVSVDSSGVEANAASVDPDISADGRYVVFESDATNLVADDTNSRMDVFVHDRQTGTTERVSVDSSEAQVSASSRNAAISADGRYVAFDSDGMGGGSASDVFVRDRVAGTTTLVSLNDPVTGNNIFSAAQANISADGRFVAFQASVSFVSQIYRFDRSTSDTVRVSTTSTGDFGNGSSYFPSISADGRTVGFESNASDLISGDTNGTGDVFVRDFQAKVMERVSLHGDGSEGCCESLRAHVSADGRFVAFDSQSPLAPPDDDTQDQDVFLRDRDGQLPRALPAERTYGSSSSRSGWLRSTTRQEADPVDTATGAFVAEVIDATLPGIGETFAFTRSYTSADTTAGPLGPGWTHPYAASLTIDTTSQDISARAGSGAQLDYAKNLEGGYNSADGVLADLAAVGTDFEITTDDLRTFRYDSAGRLIAVEDRNGQGLSLAYDVNGNLASVSGSGRTVTFTYDASNLLTRMDLPDGRYLAYGYTSGRLTSVTDLAGGTTTYTYDAGGNLATIVDQNNHTVVSSTYDTEGRVVSQTDARNHTGTFSYVDNGDGTQTTSYTDARNHDWVDVYAGNVLLSSTDPLGNTTSYSYDADYNVAAVTDPRGNTTSMTYDTDGNLVSRTAPAPLSYQESWTYNAAGQVLTHTNARGKTTSNTYDTAGNLTSVTDPASGVTSFAYDTSGLLTSTTDPRGKTTTYAYTTSGDLTSVTGPAGGITTHGYDSAGRRISTVEPRGNETGATPADYTTAFTYDNADRPLTITDPLGNATTNAYDPVGNLTSMTDPANQTTSYGYDDANNLTSVTAPDTTVTTYTYDPVGNLASRTDPNQHAETYSYDAANRLTSRTNPIGTWAYSYDANGNQTIVDPPGTDSVTTSYDVLNRPTLVDYTDTTPDVTYTYDANGNRTSMSDGAGSVTYNYDDLDRPTAITRGTDTFSYGYDANGNVTSRTYPDTTVVNATFDNASRLATVAVGTETTTYGYDAAGNLTTTDYPSGNGIVETRAYDRAGRLTDVTHDRSGTTIAKAALTLDAAGNPTTISDEASVATAYTYDNRHRLTKACFNTTSCTGATDYIEYTYDGVSNRLTETRPSGTTTYTYNSADQLTQTDGPAGTTTYSYDPRGNRTAAGTDTYSYNLAERMTSATVPGTTTTYGYDGDGTRIDATQGTDTIDYLWDTNNPLPLLALEGDGQGGVTRRYTYGHDVHSLTDTTGTYYLHGDHLGSVLEVTDASGTTEWEYEYEPYGAERATTQADPNAPDNPMRFTGQHHDPTGLYHLRARQYDPTTGAFTAIDPVAQSQTTPYFNAYGYVQGRPTVGSDPSGLTCDGCGAFERAIAILEDLDGIVEAARAALEGVSNAAAAAAAIVATFGAACTAGPCASYAPGLFAAAGSLSVVSFGAGFASAAIGCGQGRHPNCGLAMGAAGFSGALGIAGLRARQLLSAQFAGRVFAGLEWSSFLFGAGTRVGSELQASRLSSQRIGSHGK